LLEITPWLREKHLEIIIAADALALAVTAANRLLGRVKQARGRAAVCLTGGSGPQGLYQLLALEPYRSSMPWDQVHWFIGDDRLVPIDDPLSNMGQARRAFLDRVEVPADNIHPIATDVAGPESTARRYADELRRFYRAATIDPERPLFDLVLMGLGTDGHTASLFPHAATLDEKERWVVGIEKAGLEPFVPRVTLTFPALASTREMLFLVSGRDKSEILARVLSGGDLPANRAHSHGELVWLVDRAAAMEAPRASALAKG
jgi:6-phosphogluconolactonase